MRSACILLIALLLHMGSWVSIAAGADAESTPWPAPVPRFVAPAAGEHPRLFFRKSELPEIRRRAQTPEGQAIVKRLRVLLNGSDGESMPTIFNGSGKAYAGNKAAKDDKADDAKDAPSG